MDKTLDDILIYLKSTIFIEDQNYIQYINATDIFFQCYGEEKTNIHNYSEPKLFLEKLQQDGFVNYNENEYQINLQGIEFINNGGYRKRTKKIQYKNFWGKLKVGAVLLNALILLIFAYFSFIKDKLEIEKQTEIKTEIVPSSNNKNIKKNVG